MKKTIYLTLTLALLVSYHYSSAQLSFTNANGKLNSANVHSGCPVAIVDWNNDGLDDIIRLDEGHDCYVEVQLTNQNYQTVHLGDFGGSAWAMTVADVDHNGYKDVVADGSGGIGILKTNNNGTGAVLSWLTNSNFFLQNATFADINNDGWIDLFCCDDNDESHMYLNDGTGNLLISTMVSFAVNPGMTYAGDPADSGNYGSSWIDFDNDGDMDLFVAHCRQSTSSTSDLRRKDRLFVNDGANNFTDQSTAYGIEVSQYWQTWTASFGDLDNDGDLDLVVTNHDHESQIFQNDGTGHYTDVTPGSGFDISDITPIESVIEDFDNDGYADILITGDDSRLFLNNGNMTFTLKDDIFNSNNMESFAIGDLNHDGFIDIYASYAHIYTTPSNVDDVVWLNARNSNHFITVNLKGTISNHGAIGGRATLYSSLGAQLREVRSGESYGTCNSSSLHFGLGSVTTIDSIVIRWPSGTTQTILNPAADQFITVIENDCVSPVATITASGPIVFCTGQSVTLNASAGFTYLWSDGSIGSSINVSQSGDFNVHVLENGNNCTVTSPTVSVVLNPDETPAITAASQIDVCNGQQVELNGPAGLTSYLWSDGSTTQNITVTQGGNYSLNTTGLCQVWTSNNIVVTVNTAGAVTANDVTLTQPGSTTLIATGNNITWYDAITGGNLLYSGNNYTTPVLTDTTVYFVQSAAFAGGEAAVGLANAANTYSGNNTNAKMEFTVITACTLKTVKVFTDLAGDRLIEVRDEATNALIASKLVTILPDTQMVTLDFELAPGNYLLGTDASVNEAIPTWGNSSPRLKRNNGGVTYPYQFANVLSITGSNQGQTLFYYFYDWQVEKRTCPGPRLPVTVFVTSSIGINEISASDINVYPNPANDKLYIESPLVLSSELIIYDQAGRIIKREMTKGKSNVIDISAITPGIYHLKIQNDNSQYIYKVVVQ